ncbi:MAG: response regulator, partial [Leptothrix sp. (in: b-proteobacteria)]
MPAWPRLSGRTLTLVTLLVGVALTLLVWNDARRKSDATMQDRFVYRTERIQAELRDGFDGYSEALHSVAGLLGGVPGGDRQRWRTYFEHISNSEPYPGRRVLGFAPLVHTSDLAAHVERTRHEGLTDYTLRQPASGDVHYPLAYARVFQSVPGLALGTDLAADTQIVAAVERSVQLGAAVLAGPLAASPSQAETDQVWALLTPTYSGTKVPDSAAERQRRIAGVVLETFNPMGTAGSALGPDARLIGLQISIDGHRLFTCTELQQERAAGLQPRFSRTSELHYGERTLTLDFYALSAYMAAAGESPPHEVLASGLVISLLLAWLVGSLADRRARALALVDERTTALRAALAGAEQSQAHLRRSEAQLRSYIEQSIDGVLVVDGQGRFLEANPAAEELLGRSEAELRGLQLTETLCPDEANLRAGAAHFERVVRDGRSKGEVVLCRQDGARLIVDINAVALGQDRYLGIVRDVTQRRTAERALAHERSMLEVRVRERTEVLSRTNQALEQEVQERRRVEAELVAAREQALAAAKAKADFLANMSHEIRTPMHAVIGMTALLDETPLTPEQRDYVETIRVSGDALLATINDILDFSKIESGMLVLEQTPFELGALVEQAFDMLAPRAAEKGIDLLYTLDESVPSWVRGDATRLRQILVNLLSNAVKFTEHGEVCMTVTRLPAAAGALRLQFAVRDTGIGIAAEQRLHLFKAFSQADSSTTRRYGGSGLGLAICQRLTHLMRGEIGVESTPGQGSTFSFTIQVERAEATEPHRYIDHEVAELRDRHVLLVDDNPTNLHILQTQCRRWGLQVSSCQSAAAALERLARPPAIDAAILDLQMPGMDGLQLAEAIHQRAGPHAPALLLLSSGGPPRLAHDPERRRGATLFDAQLAKPVKHTHLFEALMRLLAPGSVPRRQLQSTPRLDASLAERLPMAILVAEDSLINQRLAVGILAKLGYASDVANNGVEALALLQRRRYDLVFMDLQMPMMDGLEATRQLLASRATMGRPRIIATTANALAGDRERCLAAGMDDYLSKPMLPVDVQAVIERWAPQRQRPRHDDVDAPLIDDSLLDELRSLDEPGRPSLLDSLLTEFMAETPAALSELKRLCADPTDTSLAALAQRAHKLAGASASPAASGVAETCRHLEQHARAGEHADLPALIDQLELRFARTRTLLL